MTNDGSAHETFEHIADIGVRGRGRTVEDAFAGGAMAMMEVMFDTSGVGDGEEVELTGSSFDLQSLFVEWLNAILTTRDLRGMVFRRFEVRVEDGGEGGPTFRGRAWGESYDPGRHPARTEVKAATYSQLKVERDDTTGTWVAQCIVDV